jgi:dTDP-4-dehydrorhamnose 3,5-epimerase
VRDPQTVTPGGQPVAKLVHGVTFRDAPTQVDDRGTLVEAYDPRWGWHPDPLVYAYCVTLRPGKIKGWALHEEHEDRYFMLFGELEVVLYDERQDSPTRGLVSKVFLTEFNRRLMNIPRGVWHADHNPGSRDAIFLNFPTVPYNHANPDKYRLPVDADRIPYRFDNLRGY